MCGITVPWQRLFFLFLQSSQKSMEKYINTSKVYVMFMVNKWDCIELISVTNTVFNLEEWLNQTSYLTVKDCVLSGEHPSIRVKREQHKKHNFQFKFLFYNYFSAIKCLACMKCLLKLSLINTGFVQSTCCIIKSHNSVLLMASIEMPCHCFVIMES